MTAFLQSASMPLLAMLAQSMLVAGLALLFGRLVPAKHVAVRITIYRAAVLSILVLLVVGPASRSIVAPLIQLGSPSQSAVVSSNNCPEPKATLKYALPKRSDQVGQHAFSASPQIFFNPEPVPRPAPLQMDAYQAFSLVCLAGSVVLLAGVFAGSLWLFRLRRNSTPHRRFTGAVISRQVLSTFVGGAVRPTIYLPADLDVRYPSEIVDTIIQHERVHIEQRDCLWNLLTRLACAFSWISPLTWILSTKLRHDSELLCDRLVLDSGIEPSVYAGCLLRMAESLTASPTQRHIGIGIVTSKSQLSKRISLMLSTSTHPVIIVTKASKFRIASLFAMVLVGATMVVSASSSHRGLHDAAPDGTVKEFFNALNKEDWRGAISRIEGANVDTVVSALENFPKQEYGRIV